MVVVAENVDIPAGVDPAGAVAALQLVGANGVALDEALDTTTDITVAGRHIITLDGIDPNSPAAGSWQLTDKLVPNANLDIAGTAWSRTLGGPGIGSPKPTYAIVPATGGPYKWRRILTAAPAAIADSALAAHAASTTLHGGGQELGFADIGQQSTTSTSYVDIPGASITFVVPARPYVVTAWMPILIGLSGADGNFRLVYGSTPTVLAADSRRAQFGNQTVSTHLRARVPCLLQPSPTVGQPVTYKLQFSTSSASSTVVVNFLGGNLAQLQAVTC